MLRYAQSPRSNVLVTYAYARRIIARLASEVFLSSLKAKFFRILLMLGRSLKFGIRRAALSICLLLVPACTNHVVKLVDPQSGATMECSGSGFGLGSAWVQGYIDDCIRRSESRGFAQVDKLTPEQRLGLESRGLLPKSDGAPAASK